MQSLMNAQELLSKYENNQLNNEDDYIIGARGYRVCKYDLGTNKIEKYAKVIDLIYNFSIYLIHYFLPLQKLFFGLML